jgi:hypothetical protein
MPHNHPHSDRERHSSEPIFWKTLHRDWRLWGVVLLMLVAMGIYLATVDEAVAPGVEPGPEVPAAAH